LFAAFIKSSTVQSLYKSLKSCSQETNFILRMDKT
jgi:hypothetical protein